MVLTDMDVVSHLSNIKYRLRKAIPVCNKNDPICANSIYLSYSKPITVGRTLSEDVQVRLLSKTTPLMISRRHASIYISDDGKINIEDHNSMNGVYVTSKRISPGTPHQIKVGDKVAFGCGIGTAVSEFEYYLESIPSTPVSIRRMDSPRADDYEYIHSSPAKRKRTPHSSPAIDSPSLTIIESNAAQIKEQEDRIRQLSIDLKQKEEAQDELMNRLEETEKGLLDKLDDQKQQLEKERNEAEDHLRNLLERQLQEKEHTLKNEYDEQIRLLQKEKDVVEKNLHNELCCKLSEKDEAYQKALHQQKAALEKAMTDKENEKNTLIAQLQAKEGLIEKYKSVEENHRQLENCVENLRREIEEKEEELNKQKEYTKKVESDAKQTVIQTMEDEFTCIICQELFVDATTLPCAHSFCELCLRLWLRKKKTCPVCRRKLKVKAFRSVVLDSAIEKMIEAMDDDTRKRRVDLKREREEQKRCEDAAEDPEGIREMIHRAEDDDNQEEWDNSQRGRNDRSMNNNDNRNRGNRGNYRRRSRSRSPRNQHIRHRPYHDNRFNYNSGSSNQGGSSNFQQNPNQNAAQIFHQLTNNYSNQRFYTERVEGYQPYFPSNNFQNHFSGNNQQYAPSYSNNNNNNSNRCFVCGSTDHLARFCPRR